jgi:FHS family L-fucose permease-like MFS transporter
VGAFIFGLMADRTDMSRGFIVPMFCFAFVAFYGFQWPKFSKADSLQGMKISAGH